MLVKAIEQFAASTGTTEERKASIEQTLRRTLLKGSPSNEESTRMIGAFVEATTALQFASGDEAWKKDHRRRLGDQGRHVATDLGVSRQCMATSLSRFP